MDRSVKLWQFLVALAAMFALSAVGVAVATIPNSAGEITGCYATKGGALRLIDVDLGQKCKSTERQVSWNQRGVQGPAGDVGTAVAVATSSGYSPDTTSTGWEELPGASVTIEVPADLTQLLLIRFEGESYCRGLTGTYCRVRVLVDGQVARPTGGSFDFTENITGFGVASTPRSIDRAFGPVSGGTHTVRVEYGVDYAVGQSQFSIGHWILSVQRASPA